MKKLMFIVATALFFAAGCSSQTQKKSISTSFDHTLSYQPKLGDIWQYQLTGQLNLNTNATVYDIDLFDTSKAQIEMMKANGVHVICYFSAGSSEDWRSDFKDFLPSDMGHPLDPQWVGERWLDIRSSNVRSLMLRRLDLAEQKGCEGVEADNVDGYTNDPGFDFSAADQLEYNRFLAFEAHQRGLAIGLKNEMNQVKELLNNFDFSVNEQCHFYNECDLLSPFISAGKPVFNVEYDAKYIEPDALKALCQQAKKERFSTNVLPLMLDGSWRYNCKEYEE